MATYRDALRNLSGQTEARLVALHRRHDAGEIDVDEFTALATTVLASADERAAGLSDAALALAIARQLRRPVPALGLTADTTREARRAVTTLLARLPGTTNPTARVERLGRARPLGTAGRVFDEGMARRSEVRGYVRGLSPRACELCVWLYRGGHVYPADQPMHRHPGCTCVPIPTTS